MFENKDENKKNKAKEIIKKREITKNEHRNRAKNLSLVPELYQIMAPYDHIIWDWNGTLLNDLNLVVSILGDVMERHGLQRPSKESYREVFQFPVQKYYEQLGVAFTQHYTFQELSNEFHETYGKRLAETQLFEGMIEVLEFLAPQKMLSILSAAPQDHLEMVIQKMGLHIFFTHIYGLADNLAHSKVQRGVQLIKASGVSLDKTLLIGDTDHDYEVGKHLGIEVLLIGDGHQSPPRLRRVHHRVLETRYCEPSQ